MDEAFIVAVRRKDGGIPGLAKAVGKGYTERGPNAACCFMFWSREGARDYCARMNKDFDSNGQCFPYGVFKVVVAVEGEEL